MIVLRRLEVQFSDDDPVGLLLMGLPRGQRSKIVRMILHAALLPGGWARIADGFLAVAADHGDVKLSRAQSTSAHSEADVSEPTAQAGSGMSSAGRKSFADGLRQFGVQLDD